MEEINRALGLAVKELSDQNYTQSLAFYRLWFNIEQAYPQIPSDQISDPIWHNRAGGSIAPQQGELFHSTAHLVLRFASDVESDPLLAPHSSGLQSRLSARTLREFFKNNLKVVDGYGGWILEYFYADANLIAHWVNLGYVEEAAIRNYILQSLISHPKLNDHQADALIILFKLAGTTFAAYADPSVVDRCFELLKGHNYTSPYPSHTQAHRNYIQQRTELVQVNASCTAKCDYRTEEIFQEIVGLRERGWVGLPPPPVFTSGGPNPTGMDQRDPATTPVATSLGLLDRDPGPQGSQIPPLESVAVLGADQIPASPVNPAIQSPSISVTTLSDFTIADVSDDGSPVGSTFADTSDDEPPIDPTAVVPHETFYLDDGNVEVLCGNTLFRVTISTLSFQSPALRQIIRKNLVRLFPAFDQIFPKITLNPCNGPGFGVLGPLS